jgi:hypothetical protein
MAFGELDSMAVPFALGAPPLAHISTALRLRRKISAWASGGSAGGRRLAGCLGEWRTTQAGKHQITGFYV